MTHAGARTHRGQRRAITAVATRIPLDTGLTTGRPTDWRWLFATRVVDAFRLDAVGLAAALLATVGRRGTTILSDQARVAVETRLTTLGSAKGGLAGAIAIGRAGVTAVAVLAEARGGAQRGLGVAVGAVGAWITLQALTAGVIDTVGRWSAAGGVELTGIAREPRLAADWAAPRRRLAAVALYGTVIPLVAVLTDTGARTHRGQRRTITSVATRIPLDTGLTAGRPTDGKRLFAALVVETFRLHTVRLAAIRLATEGCRGTTIVLICARVAVEARLTTLGSAQGTVAGAIPVGCAGIPAVAVLTDGRDRAERGLGAAVIVGQTRVPLIAVLTPIGSAQRGPLSTIGAIDTVIPFAAVLTNAGGRTEKRALAVYAVCRIIAWVALYNDLCVRRWLCVDIALCVGCCVRFALCVGCCVGLALGVGCCVDLALGIGCRVGLRHGVRLGRGIGLGRDVGRGINRWRDVGRSIGCRRSVRLGRRIGPKPTIVLRLSIWRGGRILRHAPVLYRRRRIVRWRRRVAIVAPWGAESTTETSWRGPSVGSAPGVAESSQPPRSPTTATIQAVTAIAAEPPNRQIRRPAARPERASPTIVTSS